jgi:hypothetical protein
MSASIPHKRPSEKAIIRAVASSTAIETGQRIADLETKLVNARTTGVFPVALAIKPSKRKARG